MRKLSALIGFVLAMTVIVITFNSSGVEAKYFINLIGAFIVLGGSLSAIFLSYSLEDVAKIISISSSIFLKEEKKYQNISKDLLQFSQKCLVKGIPTERQKAIHPFLDDCLMMINESYTDDEIRKVLEQRIDSMYESEMYDMNMLRSMSKYPPAFGMIGTVVGLIALMSSIGGEAADVSQIGNYMAVALTTTLYGLVLANFIFKPISDSLENSSIQKMKVRKLIMETCILIKAKSPLVVVQDTINSLIPPKYAIEDEYLSQVMSNAA